MNKCANCPHVREQHADDAAVGRCYECECEGFIEEDEVMEDLP